MQDIMWRDVDGDSFSEYEIKANQKESDDFWRSLGLEGATSDEKRRALEKRAQERLRASWEQLKERIISGDVGATKAIADIAAIGMDAHYAYTGQTFAPLWWVEMMEYDSRLRVGVAV